MSVNRLFQFVFSKGLWNVFLIVLLLALIAFPVFGRERSPDSSLEPLFEVVTPLEGAVVSDDVLFMVKPARGVSSVTLRMLSPDSDWSTTLDSSSGFMGSFDFGDLEDGSYVFELESCDFSSCDLQSVSVTLNRAPESRLRPVRESRTEEVSPNSVIPSNVFGVFSVTNPRTEEVFRSSGDPFVIPDGLYDVSALLVSGGNIDLSLSRVDVSSDETLIGVIHADSDAYDIDPSEWMVSDSYRLFFAFNYNDGRITLPARDGYTIAYCADWRERSQNCDDDWLIFSESPNGDVPRSSVVASNRSVVIAYVRKPVRPDESLPPITPEDVRPIPVPDENVEYVLLTPSSIPSTLILFNDAGERFDLSVPTLIPKDVYRAELDFYHSSLSSVSLDGVRIDANGTLVEWDENVSLSSLPSVSSWVWLGLGGIHIPYSFASGSFSIHPSHSSDGFLSCLNWNFSLQKCQTDFIEVSPISDGARDSVERVRDERYSIRPFREENPDVFHFPLYVSSQSIGWVSLPSSLQLDQPLEGYAANDLPHVKALLSKAEGSPSDVPLSATLTFPDGSVHDVGEENIEKITTGEFDVRAFHPRSFKPGLYTITVKAGESISTLHDSSSHSSAYFQSDSSNEASRTFYWGLIAANTRHSIYKPGETAEFEIVVLDKDSLGVKKASVVLFVHSPDGKTSMLTTGTDSVLETTAAGVYIARLPVSVEGVYDVEVYAKAPGINTFIRTTFDVRSHYDFDIIRATSTKIDPARQPLDVGLTISTVDSNAQVVTVREFVPLDFNVETGTWIHSSDDFGNPTSTYIPNLYASVYESRDEKIIEWKDVPLDVTGSTRLSYQYFVPDLKPWLYLLGPIEVASDANNSMSHSVFPAPGRRRHSDSFWEARSWMVAVDANPTGRLFFRTDTAAIKGDFNGIHEPSPNDVNCGVGCGFSSYSGGSLHNPRSFRGLSDINGASTDVNTITNTTQGVVRYLMFISSPLIAQTITSSGTWEAGNHCDISSTTNNTVWLNFNVYVWKAVTDSNGDRILTNMKTSASCPTTNNSFRRASKAGQVSSVTFARGDKIVVEMDVNKTGTGLATTMFTNHNNTGTPNDGNVSLPSGITLQFAGDANVETISPASGSTFELSNEFVVDVNSTCDKKPITVNSGFSCGDVNVMLTYCVYSEGQCTTYSDMNTVTTSPLYISTGSELQSDDALAAGDRNTFTFQVTGGLSGLYQIRSRVDSNWMRDINTSFKTNSDINVHIDTNSSCDLNNLNCFQAVWNGGVANEMLGYAEFSGSAVQLVNVDGNAFANDLIFVAPYADINGKTDAGAVYLVKDIDSKSGQKDFNVLVNFDVRWSGSAASDFLGRHNTVSTDQLDEPHNSAVQLVNVDGNAFANDLLISASFADSAARSNAGAVYLIKDINTLSGVKDLNASTSFSAAFFGSSPSDGLGSTFSSGQTVILGNLDGNYSSNDLLFSVPLTDFTAATAGSLYMVKDINTLSGVIDLNSASNFHARWDGEAGSANLGWSNDSGNGAEIVNIDNNAFANDVLLIATGGGALFNGKVYLIKDINVVSGITPLSTSTNYAAAWVGGSILDALGTTSLAGDGVQVGNLDGNTYANDLVISGSVVDAGAGDTGAVYVVLDADRRSGSHDMATSSNYNVRFAGGSASDKIGDTLTAGQGVQIVNVDGNSFANDLLITASFADVGAADSGALYLIRDINKLSGNLALSSSANYAVRWSLTTAGDILGGTQGSGLGVQLVNMDNNLVSNDLLITAVFANISGGDQGAVYLISDINTLSGNADLPTTTNFTLRIYGEVQSTLGSSNFSGQGVQLVNVDGNLWPNDLLISASLSDVGGTDRGAVYLIRDINRYVGTGNDLDLSSSANYASRWIGGTTSSILTDTNASGLGMQLVNMDKNLYSNDLILSTPFTDVNGKTDAGGVYLFRDVDKNTGSFDLNRTFNFTMVWSGGITSDFLGSAPGSGPAVQSVSVDGNSFNNDLVFTSYYADINSKANSGAVHMIRNVIQGDPSVFSVKVVSPSDYNTLTGTQRIDLNLLGIHLFATDFNFDLNYSTSAAEGTGTVIINDGNVATTANLYCDFNNLNYSPTCHYNWDTSSVANGTYYILFRATSSSLTAFDQSDNPFTTSNVLIADYSFVLMLPSSGCTVGKGNITGGSSCQRGWIETSDTSGASDENKVNPEGQSDGTPFFVYDNQSTTSSDLNILLDLNASLPGTLQFKVSKVFTGWNGTCTGNTDTNCLLLSTTATNAGKATYTTGSLDLNLYVWGDFIAAGILEEDRNVDSNATSSV